MRLTQRLTKLEKTIGRLKQPQNEVPQKEPTEEEEADAVGELLWFNTVRSKNYPPSSSSCYPTTHILYAWNEAADLAWQEGHREYHIELRPFAMAIWLEWKPRILKKRRADRDWIRVHGEWVWDDPPLIQNMSLDEFKLLPTDEKIQVLLHFGKGHWANDKKRSKRG
jgi:hypothetical protein